MRTDAPNWNLSDEDAARHATAGVDTDDEEQVTEDARALRRLRASKRARKQLKIEERGGVIVPPATSLADLLDEPDEEVRYRVDGLWPTGGRVVFSAARKFGKTTLLGNLVRSLVDGVPFLGRFDVEPVTGTVAVIDTEMNRGMLKRWYRDIGITNTERVRVWPLRGKTHLFDVTDEDVRAEWAATLRGLPGGTSALLLDCVSPMLTALNLTESNEDVSQLLTAFDALLVEAGVGEGLLAHHMGHGPERSRGGSRLRDWPEAEWRGVRERGEDDEEVENGARFFSAYGRDVEVPDSRLEFDQATRRLIFVGGDRRDLREERGVRRVLATLESMGGEAESLRALLTRIGGNAQRTSDHVREAVRLGYVETEPGAGNSHRHRLTDTGRAYLAMNRGATDAERSDEPV